MLRDLRQLVFAVIGVLLLFAALVFRDGFTIEAGEMMLPCIPCSSTPYSYRIGDVDPRYGISQEKFRDLAARAEFLWETAVGRDLFVYDPNGGLPLNLVYGQREMNRKRQVEIKSRIKELVSAAQEAVSEMEEANETLRRLDDEDLRKTVVFDAYLDWKDKSIRLLDEASSLVAESNELAEQLEHSVMGILHRENGDLKYIDIYHGISDDEMVRILAHEFGHTMGLPHLVEPGVMQEVSSLHEPRLSTYDIGAAQTTTVPGLWRLGPNGLSRSLVIFGSWILIWTIGSGILRLWKRQRADQMQASSMN
jgi:hypothetical protein